MPEPTIQATFNMTPDLHERLKRQAGAENRSMREIMEDALNSYLSERPPVNVVRSKPNEEEAAAKAKK